MDIEQEGDSVSTAVSKDNGLTGNEDPMSLVEKFGLEAQGVTTDDANEESEISVVSGANAPSLNSNKKKKKKNKKRRNKNIRTRDTSVINNTANNCTSDNDGHGHVIATKLASNETLHHSKDNDDEDGQPLVVTTYVCSSSELDKVRKLIDENGNPPSPVSTFAISSPTGKQPDTDINTATNDDDVEEGSPEISTLPKTNENKEEERKSEELEPEPAPQTEIETEMESPNETSTVETEKTELPTEIEVEQDLEKDDDDDNHVEGENQVRCKSSVNVIFKVGAAVFENPPQSLTSVDRTSSSSPPETENADDGGGAGAELDPTKFYPTSSASDEPIIKYDANQKSLGELWMADTEPADNDDTNQTVISNISGEESQVPAQEVEENRLINTDDIILNDNLINNNYIQQHNLPFEPEQIQTLKSSPSNNSEAEQVTDNNNTSASNGNQPETDAEVLLSSEVQKEHDEDDPDGHPLINELSADHLSEYKVPDVPNPSVENPDGLVNMNLVVQPPLLHPHSLARLALLKRENPQLVTFAQSAVDKVINSAQEYMNSQVVEDLETETKDETDAGVTKEEEETLNEAETEPIVESPSEALALALTNQNLEDDSKYNKLESDKKSAIEINEEQEQEIEEDKTVSVENFEEKQPSTPLHEEGEVPTENENELWKDENLEMEMEMENDTNDDDDEQEEIVKNNLKLQEKVEQVKEEKAEEEVEELDDENNEEPGMRSPSTGENCTIKFQHFTNLTFGLNAAQSKCHCEDDESKPENSEGERERMAEPSSGVEDEPSLTDEEMNTIEKTKDQVQVEGEAEMEEKAETSTEECDYETAEDVSLNHTEDPLLSFSMDESSSAEADLAQAEDLNLSICPGGSSEMDETHQLVQHLDLNETKFSSSPEFKSAGETSYEYENENDNEHEIVTSTAFQLDAEDNPDVVEKDDVDESSEIDAVDVNPLESDVNINTVIEQLKECDIHLPDENVNINDVEHCGKFSSANQNLTEEIRIVLSANKSTLANISASASSSRSVSSMGSIDDDIIKLPKVPNPSVENHHLAHLSVPTPQINAHTFARLVPRPDTIETRDFGIESQQQLDLEPKGSKGSIRKSTRESFPKLSPSVSITSTGAGSGTGTRISLPDVPEEPLEDITTDSVTNDTASEKTITFNSDRNDEEEEETEAEVEEEDFDLNNMDVGEVVKMTKQGATGGIEMEEENNRLSGNLEMSKKKQNEMEISQEEQDETNQNWVIDPHVIEDALTESEMGEPDRKARSSLIKNLWNCFGKRGRDKSANRESSVAIGSNNTGHGTDGTPRPKFRSLSRRK